MAVLTPPIITTAKIRNPRKSTQPLGHASTHRGSGSIPKSQLCVFFRYARQVHGVRLLVKGVGKWHQPCIIGAFNRISISYNTLIIGWLLLSLPFDCLRLKTTFYPYPLFADLNPSLDLYRQGNQAYPGLPTHHLRSERIQSLKYYLWVLPQMIARSVLYLSHKLAMGDAVASFDPDQPSPTPMTISALHGPQKSELHSAPLQASTTYKSGFSLDSCYQSVSGCTAVTLARSLLSISRRYF